MRKLLFKGLFVFSFALLGKPVFAQYPSPPAYFKEQNLIGVGVGYGGGLGGPGIAYDLLPGYTGTVSPGLMFTYEFHMSQHWGIGAVLSFSTATYTNNNMNYTLDSAGGTYNRTFSDKISGTYIGLAGKGYYHFGKSSTKFDTYGAVILGYTFIASSQHTLFYNNTFSSSGFFPGLLLGVAVGARVKVSKQIGIWAELGFTGVPDYLANAGITYTFIPKS